MYGQNSKFTEPKALESWQFVWKKNVKNEDFRGAWEERKKEKYHFLSVRVIQ